MHPTPMRDALGGPDGALTNLAKHDADIARAMDRFGLPPDRSSPGGFETLARIIIGQQISRSAATSIWNRMQQNNLATSRSIATTGLQALRKAGLSGRKAEYIHGLACGVEDGSIALDELARLPAEEISNRLTSIRGIGSWTADNYRLFVLLDMDAWPYNDLALQEGMRILKNLEQRPDGRKMANMGEKWRPWRGAGALMLWHVYARVVRDGSPMDAS